MIAQLARNYGLDVSILGAAVETIGGNQARRTRLKLPGFPRAMPLRSPTCAGRDCSWRSSGMRPPLVKE